MAFLFAVGGVDTSFSFSFSGGSDPSSFSDLALLSSVITPGISVIGKALRRVAIGFKN
jgi:hypothetical protein